MSWNDLKFWTSGEWQVLQERLDDLDRKGVLYNPKREDLFAAMDACPLAKTKVAIFGQDPYPNRLHATGVAFSTPECISREKEGFPPTLVNIFKEYSEDLHLLFPERGSLLPWASEGVFLWNAIPSCYSGQPGSHRHWDEWKYLTKEITEVLNEQGCVFVFLGGLAGDYLKYVDQSKCIVLSYSHPSPLGVAKSKSPFQGSRIFSTINDHLCKQGKGSISWRLE